MYKILFLSSDKFPPFRADVSELFGDEIVSQGHKIDWALQSDNECKEEYKTTWKFCNVYVGTTNLGTTRLDRINKHMKGISHDIKTLFKLTKKNRYDFIIVKDKFLTAIAAIALSRIHKIKFIYWLSYPFPESSIYSAKTGSARYPIIYLIRGWFLKLLLYRFIMPLSDHIFVQSDQMKHDVELEGISKENITAVPMGISRKTIEHANSVMLENVPGDCDILYVGTLISQRKMDFMVRVLKEVHKKLPGKMLYFVGAGERQQDEQKILDEADRLNLKNYVVITGKMPRELAIAYIRKSKVCVSPFYPTPILNSTSPTKLIEYMAMKKPSVANDHPEQKKVLAESKAGICVPYDERAFANAIVSILSNEDKAIEMGKRGLNYVLENRTYDILAKVVIERFHQILAKTN